jgi:hypothetical protein
MEYETSMAPLKVNRSGWKSAHHLCLPNYGSSTSSLYEAQTQNADYGGVEEAAGVENPRGVSHGWNSARKS